jgi:hypothetical protein
VTHLRILVREHDCGVADSDLCVPDPALGGWHAHQFDGAERPLVEVDGLRRIFDDQIGRDRVIAFRNSSGHDRLLAGIARLFVKARKTEKTANVRAERALQRTNLDKQVSHAG